MLVLRASPQNQSTAVFCFYGVDGILPRTYQAAVDWKEELVW